jgi:hypothetical protein
MLRIWWEREAGWWQRFEEDRKGEWRIFKKQATIEVMDGEEITGEGDKNSGEFS